jgi:hypothetical protein
MQLGYVLIFFYIAILVDWLFDYLDSLVYRLLEIMKADNHCYLLNKYMKRIKLKQV